MKTIRQQLTRKLLISIGLLLTIGCLTVYICTRTALFKQFDAALLSRAQAIATLTEQNDGHLEIEFSDQHMRGFDAGEHGYFHLRDSQGKTVERSRSLGEATLPLPKRETENPLFWNLTLPSEPNARAVGIRFHPQNGEDHRKDTPADEVLLVVASSRRDLDRTLATLQIVLSGCGLLLLAATAFVVPRVLRCELKPLQTLAEDAAQIDADSLSARFPTKDLPGELAPIATRLNELLGRLEESFERERRFSSDVAHEFRTPVAELRTLSELAIKLPNTPGVNTHHETLAISLHLESMLTRLLALARGERGALPVQRERVDMALLVQDICNPFHAKAANHGLAFELNTPSSVATVADPALLRSILTNLVENALAYTPRGGQISVHVTGEMGTATVRVINTVKDLNQTDLPHFFERFWRKDPARSGEGHVGLGLSLAHAFADAMGFDLTVSLVGPTQLAMTLNQRKVGNPNS